jgi:hypothetical protein
VLLLIALLIVLSLLFGGFQKGTKLNNGLGPGRSVQVTQVDRSLAGYRPGIRDMLSCAPCPRRAARESPRMGVCGDGVQAVGCRRCCRGRRLRGIAGRRLHRMA